MSARLWAPVCLVALTACLNGFGADAPENQKLVLFLTAQSAVPDAVKTAMQTEVAALMRPAAIDVIWREAATERGGIEAPHAAVVHLAGSCGVSKTVDPTTSLSNSLASSPVADGLVLSFNRVDCQTLNAYIGPSLNQLPADRRSFLYGRAIARLVAHELYHVLTGSTDHAQGGIAKPTFTRSELLSDHFDFGLESVARIQPSTDSGAAFEDAGK